MESSNIQKARQALEQAAVFLQGLERILLNEFGKASVCLVLQVPGSTAIFNNWTNEMERQENTRERAERQVQAGRLLLDNCLNPHYSVSTLRLQELKRIMPNIKSVLKTNISSPYPWPVLVLQSGAALGNVGSPPAPGGKGFTLVGGINALALCSYHSDSWQKAIETACRNITPLKRKNVAEIPATSPSTHQPIKNSYEGDVLATGSQKEDTIGLSITAARARAGISNGCTITRKWFTRVSKNTVDRPCINMVEKGTQIEILSKELLSWNRVTVRTVEKDKKCGLFRLEVTSSNGVEVIKDMSNTRWRIVQAKPSHPRIPLCE